MDQRQQQKQQKIILSLCFYILFSICYFTFPIKSFHPKMKFGGRKETFPFHRFPFYYLSTSFVFSLKNIFGENYQTYFPMPLSSDYCIDFCFLEIHGENGSTNLKFTDEDIADVATSCNIIEDTSTDDDEFDVDILS